MNERPFLRMDALLKHIATLGFIGYIPYAPGTFGSLCAFIFYIILQPSLTVLCAVLLCSVPLGVLSSHYAERLMGEKDSAHIVIDEFCGYLLSVLVLPFSVTTAVAAFFLFRIFDILKPFPIREIEHRFAGGIGIMADDVAAAIYANIVLQIGRAVL